MKWNKLPKGAKVKVDGSPLIFEGCSNSRVLLRTENKTMAFSLSDKVEFVKKGKHYELVEKQVIFMVDSVNTPEMRQYRRLKFLEFIVKVIFLGTIVAVVWHYMGWI